MSLINLASIVFEARKKTGLNQMLFAHFMERSQMSIWRYETGVSKPSMRFIEKCKLILSSPAPELSACIEAFKKRTLLFKGLRDEEI